MEATPHTQPQLAQTARRQEDLTALQDRIGPHFRRPELQARVGPFQHRGAKGWHSAEASFAAATRYLEAEFGEVA